MGEGKEALLVGITGLKEGWLEGGGVRGGTGGGAAGGREVGVAREPADSPTP